MSEFEDKMKQEGGSALDNGPQDLNQKAGLSQDSQQSQSDSQLDPQGSATPSGF